MAAVPVTVGEARTVTEPDLDALTHADDVLDAIDERDTVLHGVADVDKDVVCERLCVRVPTVVRVSEAEALTDAVTVHDEVARDEGEPEVDAVAIADAETEAVGPFDTVAEAEHDEGCVVIPNEGQTDRQSQGVQEVEPFTGEYEPGKQTVQFDAPIAEKEPAGQVIGFTEESGHCEPAGQRTGAPEEQ